MTEGVLMPEVKVSTVVVTTCGWLITEETKWGWPVGITVLEDRMPELKTGTGCWITCCMTGAAYIGGGWTCVTVVGPIAPILEFLMTEATGGGAYVWVTIGGEAETTLDDLTTVPPTAPTLPFTKTNSSRGRRAISATPGRAASSSSTTWTMSPGSGRAHTRSCTPRRRPMPK